MKKFLTLLLIVTSAEIMVYVGIVSSFLVRFFIDQQIVVLKSAGQPTTLLEFIVKIISSPLYFYGVWGLLGAYLGSRLIKHPLVVNLFSNNIKSGFTLGILGLVSIFINAGLIGAILGIVGFFKSKQAVKEGKSWGILAGLINLIPVFYILFILFILGYTLTSH